MYNKLNRKTVYKNGTLKTESKYDEEQHQYGQNPLIEILYYENGKIKTVKSYSFPYKFIENYIKTKNPKPKSWVEIDANKKLCHEHNYNYETNRTQLIFYNSNNVASITNYELKDDGVDVDVDVCDYLDESDRPIGKYREWHPNNVLRCECKYIDGSLSGLYKSWYDTGKLRSIKYYKIREYLDRECDYCDHATGNFCKYSIECNNNNCVYSKTYHDNGQIAEIRHGYPNSIQFLRRFNKSGNLCYIKTQKRTVKYHDNGQRSGLNQNNILTEWDENGIIQRVVCPCDLIKLDYNFDHVDYFGIGLCNVTNYKNGIVSEKIWYDDRLQKYKNTYVNDKVIETKYSYFGFELGKLSKYGSNYIEPIVTDEFLIISNVYNKQKLFIYSLEEHLRKNKNHTRCPYSPVGYYSHLIIQKYENGQQMSEKNFTEYRHRPSGLWKGWYRSGKIKYQGINGGGYTNALKYWFGTSKLKIDFEKFKTYREWYENGQLKYEILFDKKLKNNLLKKYHKNGQLDFKQKFDINKFDDQLPKNYVILNGFACQIESIE